MKNPYNVKLPVFYSEAYTSAAHAWDTTRKSADVASLLCTDNANNANIELLEPRPLRIEQIMRAHDSKYIHAVRSGEHRALAETNGFRWCPNLFNAVCASNGGVLTACVAALKLGVAGSLSSGLHHANRRQGAGFCTFNGLAIAAINLLWNKSVSRVLIVDYDAHFGDGTEDIISAYNGIDMIDVSSFDIYDEFDNSLDYKNPAMNRDVYLKLCMSRLSSVDLQQYDLVIYNAGMDPHEHCRIGGVPGIDREALMERDRFVFQMCRDAVVPVAFCLAGGYKSDRLSALDLASLHVGTCYEAAASLDAVASMVARKRGLI